MTSPEVAPIRTFHARAGRLSDLTRSRLRDLVPRYAVGSSLARPDASMGRLVLDVGCGHGAAALAYATAHPDDQVVAVDVHPPGIARLAALLDQTGTRNVALHLGDVIPLITDWPTASIDAVHLFFPDPWPKSRHARRRFVRPDTLALLARVMTPGGAVHLATDQPGYAAWAREQTRAAGWSVSRGERPPWRPIAGYEAKGLAAGRPPIDLVLRPGRDGISAGAGPTARLSRRGHA